MALSRDALDLISKMLGLRKQKGPLKQEKFTFVSTAVPEETFGVVNFKGQEGLSQCHRFDINLVSKSSGIDLDLMLTQEVGLLINREGRHPVAFHGILTSFEQLHQAHGFTFYRACLRPKLWYLNLIQHNRVFLNKTLTQIIEEIFQDLFPVVLTYEFRLQGDYSQPYEYVCQYQESHFNFLSRWLEREGLYYFFELTDIGEKLVITDTQLSHTDIPQETVLRYREPSGLIEGPWREIVHLFNGRSVPVAKTVRVKDYDYRKPSMDLSGQGVIHPGAQWEVYYYGDHFRTPEEGDRLARIRAEELRCQQKTFSGKSTSPYLRPGFKFKLSDHYQNSFNTDYLITSVTHEGSQAGYLVSGLKTDPGDAKEGLYYRNSFAAIPVDQPFRPPRLAVKPKFHGVISAKIDAEGSGQYAELDGWGRYKVLLPFDLSGRKDGKASTWLRLAQSFVGDNHGMHFPLHKGTEVLLTFVDGDPDRPIIASAIPNIDHPSVVNSDSATRSGFRTASGAGLVIEDLEGKEKMVIRAGDGRSQITMGRGSPVDTIISSDNISSIANILHSDLAFQSISFCKTEAQTIAGFPIIQTIYAYFHEKLSNDPGWNFASALPGSASTLLMPLGFAINSIISLQLKSIILKALLDKKVAGFQWEVGPFERFRKSSDPAILLGKLKNGNIFNMGIDSLSLKLKNKKDMVLINEDDDIHVLAMGNVGIQGNEKASLWGHNIDIVGSEEVAINSERQINVTAKTSQFSQYDPKITLRAEKEVGIATARSGEISIDHKEISISHNPPGMGAAKKPDVTIASDGKVTIDGATVINLNADTQLKIVAGGSTVEIKSGEIIITSSSKVSIKSPEVGLANDELTVGGGKLSFKGASANIGNVLRVG
jgi:type VI secretion system VgrG family protein